MRASANTAAGDSPDRVAAHWPGDRTGQTFASACWKLTRGTGWVHRHSPITVLRSKRSGSHAREGRQGLGRARITTSGGQNRASGAFRPCACDDSAGGRAASGRGAIPARGHAAGNVLDRHSGGRARATSSAMGRSCAPRRAIPGARRSAAEQGRPHRRQRPARTACTRPTP